MNLTDLIDSLRAESGELATLANHLVAGNDPVQVAMAAARCAARLSTLSGEIASLTSGNAPTTTSARPTRLTRPTRTVVGKVTASRAVHIYGDQHGTIRMG
jgi:hypothetical protein